MEKEEEEEEKEDDDDDEEGKTKMERRKKILQLPFRVFPAAAPENLTSDHRPFRHRRRKS